MGREIELSPGSGFSPLELFHPDGNVQRVLVLGSGCPQRLIPTAPPGAEGTADLVILAPTGQECRQPGWLERSVKTAVGRLASGGVVYVLAPWLFRRAIRRSLRKQGLPEVHGILHLPDWTANRYFVPLEPGPARYAFTNLFPTRPALRLLMLALLKSPGGAELAGDLLPNAGFSAQRAGNRPLFGWLEQLAGNDDDRWSVLASASWRDQRCSLVMHLFSEGARPRLVAKTEWPANQEAKGESEFDLLLRMGEAARRAGANIPQPVGRGQAGRIPVSVQQALSGRSAAARLAGQPRRLTGILEQAARWLEAWNQATVERIPLPPGQLAEALYAPLDSLSGLLPEAQAYRDWLGELLPGPAELTPLVAAHNDLTVWNILVERDQPLGVVDWKEARPSRLPLGDLYYLLVDAVCVAHRIGREAAFREVFAPAGRYAPLANLLRLRAQKALRLAPKQANLCLHACFLRHAANEQAGLNPEGSTAFLQIARILASERVTLEWEAPDA